MHHRNAIATIALAAALCAANVGARAFEDEQYPNLRGQWIRAVVPGTADEPRVRSGASRRAADSSPR